MRGCIFAKRCGMPHLANASLAILPQMNMHFLAP